MMLQSLLQQEVIQMEAHLCSALADPTRLLILYALNEQPRNVTELVNKLGTTQPTISRHLKILRDHGLVQTARQGVYVTYILADTRLINAVNILRAVLHDSLKSMSLSVLEVEIMQDKN